MIVSPFQVDCPCYSDVVYDGCKIKKTESETEGRAEKGGKGEIVSIHNKPLPHVDAASNVTLCVCVCVCAREAVSEMELIFGCLCSFFLGELFQWCVGV